MNSPARWSSATANTAWSISATGAAARQFCCIRLSREKVRIALRPENIAIGKADGANTFAARVVDRRYQGTQTVYDIDLFGHRLEALELGTAARHQVGVQTEIALPRAALWAYRDTGPSKYD